MCLLLCCCLQTCLCPAYRAKENEGVFTFRDYCTGPVQLGYMLLVSAVGTVITFFILSSMIPTYLYAVPGGVAIFGLLFVLTGGGEWLVFNTAQDEIFIVKGSFFECVKNRTYIGRLTQLVSIAVDYQSYSYYGHIRKIPCSFTFQFSNGTSQTIGKFLTRSRILLAQGMEAWLSAQQAGSHVKFLGFAPAGFENTAVLVVTHNTPLLENNGVGGGGRGGLEQDLRELVVRYQMGTDPEAQQKGEKLSLAMEYNPDSLVSTYSILRQQNDTLTAQGESVLLKSAQTIIDANSNRRQE